MLPPEALPAAELLHSSGPRLRSFLLRLYWLLSCCTLPSLGYEAFSSSLDLRLYLCQTKTKNFMYLSIFSSLWYLLCRIFDLDSENFKTNFRVQTWIPWLNTIFLLYWYRLYWYLLLKEPKTFSNQFDIQTRQGISLSLDTANALFMLVQYDYIWSALN